MDEPILITKKSQRCPSKLQLTLIIRHKIVTQQCFTQDYSETSNFLIMRLLNTTLPTGPRCDADARVGTRVFCSKGLYVCMIVCNIVWPQLGSWREQSWYEVYFFSCILFIYIILCFLRGLKKLWSCFWGQIYIDIMKLRKKEPLLSPCLCLALC